MYASRILGRPQSAHREVMTPPSATWADDILPNLLLDAQALEATVDKKNVTHTDIVDEAVIVHTDASVLSVGAPLQP